MASLFTAEQLPTTSEQAIRQFDERYLAGISAAPPPTWSRTYGDVIDVDAPRVTFPIGLLSTKYNETKEQSGRFKTLEEESFDLKVVEYDAGYEAKLIDILKNVYAYRKWTQIPGRFINAEGRHVNRNIVTLLEAGTSTKSPWDNVNFFSAASHLANPANPALGTWGNYNASTLDVININNLIAEVTTMQGVLDENGEKLGVDPDTIIVPTAKAEGLKAYLSKELLIVGSGTAPESNPYRGKFTVVHAPELTDVNDWYLVDSKIIAAAGVPPWVAAKFLAPDSLGLRFWDESSDFFKNTSKIKVASHIWYGFGLVFPHAIRRVAGA